MPLLEAGGSWTGLRHPDDVRWQLRLRSNSNHLAQSWGEAPQAGKPRGGGKKPTMREETLPQSTLYHQTTPCQYLRMRGCQVYYYLMALLFESVLT